MQHRISVGWIGITCLIGLWVLSAQGGEIIRGMVFKDANANGRRDAEEAGMAGVAVTDGVTFARSGPDGTFVLELTADPVLCAGGIPTVTVSFPSDYWPSTPWFVRLDEKRAPGDLAFGLRPQEQPRSFVFVHGSDSHVPRKGEERFARFREDVQALREVARFCIFTGDLADLADSHTQAASRAEFEVFARQTEAFPLPWFGLPGNHDIAGVRAKSGWDTNSADYGYGLYTRHVGPLRWSFDYAGIHFAGIDYNQVVSHRWAWGAPEPSVRWLTEDLKSVEPGRRIFLFVHHPAGSPALTSLLRQFPITQIFHGHDHCDALTQFANVPALSAASLAEVFDEKDRQPGYRLVHVVSNRVDTFYRSTGEPHAITVDYPRYKDILRPGETVRGAFFDPSQSIQRLSITYAGKPIQARLHRGLLWSRFEAKLLAGDLAKGTYPLVVAVEDGERSWRHEFAYRFAPDRQIDR